MNQTTSKTGLTQVTALLVAGVGLLLPWASPAQNLAAGSYHTLITGSDGQTRGWGWNGAGQLGDGTTTTRATPVVMSGTNRFLRIAAGGDAGTAGHGLGIERDGSVWGWGGNARGQIVQGSNPTLAAIKLNHLSNAVEVAAGRFHSLVLRSDGTVWGMGGNYVGQLGNGSTADTSTPVQATGLSNIVAIAAGDEHSLAVRSDGVLFTWGQGQYGQLGDGQTGVRTTAAALTNLSNIVGVSGGMLAGFAVRADGAVFGWGWNGYGIIGDGTTSGSTVPVATKVAGVVKVVAGLHASALRADGTVWAWGLNGDGQLGRGGVSSDNTLPAPVTNLSSAVDIAAGTYHSAAHRADGSVWAWGHNGYSQLGYSGSGSATPVVVTNLVAPQASPYLRHLLFVKADGTVLAAGHNGVGQLGDSTTNNRLTPVPTLNLGYVRQASAGRGHSVAVRWDGSVWAWGGNQYGQAGLGAVTATNAPTRITSLTDVAGIAAGALHTVAVRSNGTVLAWGLNDVGQLGDNSATNQFAPVTLTNLSGIKSVAAGERHSLALSTGGVVYAWGRNTYGQLGDGTLNNRPTAVTATGVTNGLMIAAGEGHSVVLRSNSTVVAFGDNRSGQLGDGTTTQRTTAVSAGSLTNVIAVTAGDAHTLALKSDGTVWAWGENVHGQLGDGTTTLRSSPVQVTNITNAILIQAQGDSSVVMLATGEALVFGANASGQLGTGGTLALSTPLKGGFQYFETFAPYIQNALAEAGQRYYTGSGEFRGYHGFVIPLSYQQGVPLNRTGDNSDIYTNELPWFMALRTSGQYPNLYRFDFVTSESSMPYVVQENVVSAFGSKAGGSPLYFDKRYSFGVYAGYQMETGSAGDSKLPLRVRVFKLPPPGATQTNITPVATNYFTVPLRTSHSQEWQTFASNGFTAALEGYGLRSTLQLVEGGHAETWWAAWGNGGASRFLNSQFVIQHTASSESSGYGFVVDGFGYLVSFLAQSSPVRSLARRYTDASTSTDDWLPLYAVNFDAHPGLRSQFLDAPQFDGQPLPSAFIGKSVFELLTNLPPVTTSGALAGQSNRTVNASPELFAHPLLDKLVSGLRHDPLALSAFVLNEIELTDPLGFGPGNNSTNPAIDYPGVSRNAVGVLRERQGSAVEQCALLVYLLRQAGYGAAYAFPTNRNVKMPDTQLSRLFRMQLRGAVDYRGILYTTESLIAVNYPWVVLDMGDGNVRHIFPWLKDTEVTEGLNLWDYMPAEYDSAYKWVRDYVLGKTNIMSLDSERDTVAALFPKFVDKHLRENWPGISLDDMGIRFRNRRHQVSRWEDLPRPLVVDNPEEAALVTDLATGTNALPRLLNVFNTLQVQVRPRGQTNVLMDSGGLRLADIGSRKFLLFTNTSGNLRLSLTPFHEGITTVTTNATNFPGDSLVMTNGHVLETSITATNFDFVLTRRKDLFWTTNDSAYLVFGKWLYKQQIRPFARDNIASVCSYPGRATPAMMLEQAGLFWEIQNRRQSDTNYTPTIEEYQGALVHLMGMKYWVKCSEFAERMKALIKVNELNSGLLGLAIFKQSTNGTITGILDMPTSTEIVLNASVRPDAGDAMVRVRDTYNWLFIAGVSAEEHATINEYLGGSDAISTVKLLQLAQKRSTGPSTDVVELYWHNYANYQNLIYTNDPATWTAITNAFSGIEADATRAFVTPGMVTNNTGNYGGVGTLIIQPFTQAAIISGTYNGGVGEKKEGFFSKLVSLLTGGTLSSKADSDQRPESVVSARAAADSDPSKPMTPEQAYAASVALAEAQMSQQGQTTLEVILQRIYDAGASGIQAVTEAGGKVADPVDVISGFFYLDATDLTLPGPMPVMARRNYSSQNPFPSQFGSGWKLNYHPYLVFITNLDSTITIRATEADGACLEYAPTATNVWTATAAANPATAHNNNEGGKNQNLLFGTRIEQVVTNGQTYYYQRYPDGALKTYLVRTDFGIIGSSNTLARVRPYLAKWQDNRSNSLSFSYGTSTNKADYGEIYRIESSAGMYLGFNYDESGRVIEAYSGDGRRLYYEYDKYGDLVAVTLPDASQIRYEYEHYSFTYTTTNGGTITTNTALDSRHLLVREVKPDGRLLVNEYDGERRVVKQHATAGQDLRLIHNATFVYSNNFYLTNAFSNSICGTTFVIDVFGNTNRYDYTNGSLTKITDPLGYSLIQDWYWTNDVPGSYTKAIKSKTDKRGLTTTFLYDTNGNIVTNIVSGADLTGNGLTNATIVSTYTNGNLLLSQTDAVGNTLWIRYGDTNYPTLPTQMERYAGGSTPIATNRLFYTNAEMVLTYGSASYTNRAFGLLTREVAAVDTSDQAITDYEYDGRGFVTNKVRYPGTGDPDVTSALFYNDRGELVGQTDAAGRTVRLAYDPRGNPEYTEKFDENGDRKFWEYSYYNENGELVWSDGPRFDPEDYVWRDYDGAGRKTQEIRWRSRAKADGTGVEAEEGYSLFATTFQEFDAFGNLLRVIDPYGNYARMTYDANGQVLSKSRYAVSNAVPLATEWFGYEAGGLVSAHTNVLGGVTKKFYTTTGKLRRQENPDGSTNGVVYRLDGRVATNYLVNGAYWEKQYDDANRRVTNTFRAANGTLKAQEVEEYDRRGNLVRKTDALGHVFTTTYDGLNRVKTVTGPVASALSGQQTNTFYYDASGIVTSNRNALGEVTVTITDALGRPIRSEVKDAAGTVLRVNTTSYAANHHSVTATVGESSTPIASTTYTDTFGLPVLTVFADDTFALNRYDMAGNLESSRDELGQVTQFAYDPFYRLQRRTTPDGAFVTFAYNAAGSLTNRVMPGGLSWSAGYNAAGRMISEVLNGGGLTARNFSFSYYQAGNAFAGLLQTVTDPLSVTHTSAYDDFLRTATRVSVGTNGTPQNQTNTFTYDALGRMLVLEQGTGGGGTTRVERGYDAYGQPTNELVKVAGTNFSQFSQTWTAAGRRSALASLIGGANGTATFGHYADGLLAQVTRGGLTSTFDYDDRGLLVSRSNIWRVANVAVRDARGRPTHLQTWMGAGLVMSEYPYWRDNSTLSAYNVNRSGQGWWDEAQTFGYNNRGQLTEEVFQPRTDMTVTNTFGFPAGTNNHGVRTTANMTGELTASWSGTANGLGRVTTESVGGVDKRLVQARGRAVGAESVRVWLDSTEVTPVTYQGQDYPGLWLADVTLTNTGAHAIRATAYHPLGRTNTSTTNSFTVVDGSGSVTNTYDAAGNVVGRQLPGGRTQALVWDGGGRLVSATERDASNHGWNWSALYDGLGRRLQTTYTPVTNGTPNTQLSTLNTSFYDPQVEFLEVAVGVNGSRTWAVHGPDVSGRYGGAQGIGGLEGTIRESDGAQRAALTDHFGNVVAAIATAELAWNGTRVTGYGPVAGQPVPWLGAGKELTEVSVWRSRRLDPTGFYWLGARYYEPGSGRFLSPDPFGHEASMTLYDYANGDPVNYLDPDGEEATAIANFADNSVAVARDTYLGTSTLGNFGVLMTESIITGTTDILRLGDGFGRGGWEGGLQDVGRISGLILIMAPTPKAGTGGPAPVKHGQQGVKEAINILESQGHKVLGEQPHIKTSHGASIPDLYVEKSTGQRVFVDVKNGKSKDPQGKQALKYDEIRTQGGVPYGPRARDSQLPVDGTPIGPTPVEIMRVDTPKPTSPAEVAMRAVLAALGLAANQEGQQGQPAPQGQGPVLGKKP